MIGDSAERLTKEMRPNQLILFFVILFHTFNCSTGKFIKQLLRTDIQSAVDLKEKLPKGKIALIDLTSKNLVSLNISATNVTDNLHFSLKEDGLDVIRVATFLNSDSSAANFEPNSTPVTLSPIRKYILADKDKVISLCVQKGTKYVLTGFIFEADIGTILDEDYSSGAILYLYDDSGELINMFKYIGYEKLLSFESNSAISNKLAQKIAKTFK
ncbi:hypothetical protein JWG41_18260 [Leptospira sp. 201903075]|uniref:hypothetical protein n=1 Tax=Leptospira chreensis TaxID=2810035 RepID=UPI0019633BE9|nr:hypothetical protein [Leptospira chreensis]MBM9592393.1 hypothetical protein [Leptospira chreensis]